jgi:hypothetical protein
MLRARELREDRIENGLLDQATPDEQLVIAGSLGGTSPLPALFPFDLLGSWPTCRRSLTFRNVVER